jgi:hypothetical protein
VAALTYYFNRIFQGLAMGAAELFVIGRNASTSWVGAFLRFTHRFSSYLLSGRLGTG